MTKRYQPWRKGPAQVISFPARCLIRAWYVRPAERGQWIGEIIGGRDFLDEGPMKTDIGSLKLVFAAVCRRDARQGLPVVLDDRAVEGGV